MVDIDLRDRPPLRFGVAQDDDVCWYRDAAAERVRGVDLTDLARRSAHLRRTEPGAEVAADIDAVIASDAATARALLAQSDGERHSGALLYVGTPTGLAGLVADIYALGIADGAVLIPRAPGVGELIRNAVLPALQAMELLTDAVSEALPA